VPPDVVSTEEPRTLRNTGILNSLKDSATVRACVALDATWLMLPVCSQQASVTNRCLSDERVYTYVADGLTEDTTILLVRMPGFFMTARRSAFVCRGQTPDVRQIEFWGDLREGVKTGDGETHRRGDLTEKHQ
jgi:hypothetical protein